MYYGLHVRCGPQEDELFVQTQLMGISQINKEFFYFFFNAQMILVVGSVDTIIDIWNLAISMVIAIN